MKKVVVVLGVMAFLAVAGIFMGVANAQPACVQAPSGLVSWWPGDGNANDIVGGNDGTLVGDATFAPGMVGQAFSFDGDGDYMQAPTLGLRTGNDNRTLEMWVKIDAFVAEEAFFAGYGKFGSTFQVYVLGTSRTNLFFSSWGPAVFGPSLEADKWYHVGVTSIGNSVKLYLNGMVVASVSLAINTPSDEQFFIGSIPDPLGIIRRHDGLVDEVQIYNRALTDAEIKAIFDAGSAGKCKGIPVGGTTTFLVNGSGSSSGSFALLVGGIAAVLSITAGGWYTRRSWLGSRS